MTRALTFTDGEQAAGPDDRVILAVPPWTAQELLPDLTAPDAFRAIVNAHFKIAPPRRLPADRRPDRRHGGMGLRLSRPPLGHRQRRRPAGRHGPRGRWPRLLWGDVAAVHDLPATTPPWRIVKEKRATFAATPAQDARRPPCRDTLGQPVPRRRLDRYRPARDDRGRAALRRSAPRPSSRPERRHFDTSTVDRCRHQPRDAGAARPAAQRRALGLRARGRRHHSRPNMSCCAIISASRTIWSWSARSASICAASRASMAAGRLFHGGAFDISATVKAYFCLKMIGDDPDAPHMAAGPRGDPGARRRCCAPMSSRASCWRCSASCPGTTCRPCRSS